jgi:phospholipase/carboxylesterase
VNITFNEQQAAESLQALIEDISALRTSDERLLVGGFSQGAAMTVAMLASQPTLLDGALILSGRKSESLVVPELNGLPVLVQHGLYDNVIPVDNGHLIRDDLAAAGAEVTYREYAMGHEVSMQSLGDLQSWLQKQLA